MKKLNTALLYSKLRKQMRNDIAKTLRISPQAVSKRLKQLHNLRVRELLALCDLMELPPDFFFVEFEGDSPVDCELRD